MNLRSPRILLLLSVITLLVVGIGVVAAVVFQLGHAKVSTQNALAKKTVIPGNEHQVVQSYNQAEMKQEWATVYLSTSHIVTGNLTQKQFAQMMSQQTEIDGTIASIVMTSSPQVYTNAGGTPYFTVQEKVVIVKNGVSRTQSVLSIFLLEEGTWKYWFSKQL